VSIVKTTIMRLNYLFILLFISLNAFAQEGFRGEHFIEVTGTAEMEVDPNEITLSIRLREFEERGSKVALEKLDQQFLDALKSAGVDRKRLELADAGSKIGKLNRREKDAFREKTYQLKVTGGAELEKLLEKIEDVKVDQVVITRVHHTELEKMKLDLKVKALQAAKSKAELLLKSVNGEMGKILMVREWDMEPVQPMPMTANVYMKSRQEDAGMAVEEESTAFRKIRMRAQVAAQFEIK
jgi:uncharacterized protein